MKVNRLCFICRFHLPVTGNADGVIMYVFYLWIGTGAMLVNLLHGKTSIGVGFPLNILSPPNQITPFRIWLQFPYHPLNLRNLLGDFAVILRKKFIHAGFNEHHYHANVRLSNKITNRFITVFWCGFFEYVLFYPHRYSIL